MTSPATSLPGSGIENGRAGSSPRRGGKDDAPPGSDEQEVIVVGVDLRERDVLKEQGVAARR